MKIAAKNIEKIEPIIFFIICFLNMLPVIQGKFFGTMDGASHLYNANLIKNLLFSESPIVSSYFSLNPEPVPNAIGHYILVFFNFFLPSYLSEKALLVFYMIAFPISFRALIKTINKKNILFSYFVFPFTYSYMFLLGFYNFSIAIVFLFLTITFWLKNEGQLTPKKIFFLWLFVMLTYFSHLFVFFILFIVLTALISHKFIVNSINFGWSNAFKKSLKEVAVFISVAFVPIVLASYYMMSRNNDSNYVFLGVRELIDSLKNIRTIITYNSSIEEVYTNKIFIIFLALLIIMFYHKINYSIFFIKKNITRKKLLLLLFGPSFVWGVLPLILLTLYFIMPDADGSGGYFSVRTALFLFLFLTIWFSTQKMAKWFLITAVVFVVFFNFKLNTFYYNTIKDLNKSVESCYKAADLIPENSVVLPLSYSDNWLMGHFFYIGLDKPTVVLENYECSHGYFPVLWNHKGMPNTMLGENYHTNDVPCLYWENNNKNPKRVIDYVFVLGHLENQTEECRVRAKNVILELYEPHYRDEYCELYKLKK